MQYVGLQTQIWRNNTQSFFLLLGFPALILSLTYLFFYILFNHSGSYYVDRQFFSTAPWIILGVMVWFAIAWFFHNNMIASATGSAPLQRTDNPRVYNLVENLCISRGMKTPRINMIDDDSLNAFASGINDASYTISLSRGIINKLNDEELEAVIGHELTHIINRDVRLMIVSIIFVGIFAFVAQLALRSFQYGGRGDKKGGAILLILVLAAVGYLLSLLFRFAISRKRELMADAGSAELTKNPLALASALRKISADPVIEAVKRGDVAQLFIEHPEVESKGIAAFFSRQFDTHPPIEERIKLLEQY